MTRPLILSDSLSKQSDDSQEHFRFRLARTPPPAGAGHAADRAGDARDAEPSLQALRPAQLPLCRRPRPRTQDLSLSQSAQRAAPQGLRAQRRCWARRSIHQQLARYTRCARRDLRHQHRTSATPRGAWIDRHASRARSVRLDPGGRHSCRHGHGLSRRRPAARCGGKAR
jgi:hypothetical protein